LVFATTAAGMAVLSLAPGSGAAFAVPLPQDVSRAFDVATATTSRSFLYVTADGELRPAGAVCGVGACSAVSLNTKSSSSADWALESLTSCGGGAGQLWSALQLANYPFHDRVVRAAQCVEVAQEQGVLSGLRVGTVDLELTALGIVAAPFVSQHMRPSAQLLFDARAASPIRHIAVLPEKGKAAACAAVRVLLVLQSGEALALRSEGCRDVRPVEALWVRQEALSRAKQAVVLSKADNDAERLAELAMGGHTMPGFPERLRLQGAKLQVRTARVIPIHIARVSYQLERYRTCLGVCREGCECGAQAGSAAAGGGRGPERDGRPGSGPSSPSRAAHRGTGPGQAADVRLRQDRRAAVLLG
jgi:hypothetical protein